jgi:NTE family protein
MDYAMRGKQMLADFDSAFLQKPVQKMLFRAAYLNPVNLFKLLFDPHFHRIDVAAQVYDDVLFHNATFTDLLKVQKENDRPFIIANATELEIGSRFEWTQDQFDPICSDILPTHVARAVAASSDFPFLLPPMTLQKYDASTCKYQKPSWYELARNNDAYANPARTRYATELEDYLDPARKYLHTVDGGIADNIGLRGPLQALMSTDTFVQPQNGRTGFTLIPLINQTPPRPIDRVLIIVVNAGTEGPVSIDTKSKLPNLITIVGGISGTPMSNYSFDSLQLLLATVGSTARLASGVRYYPVNVSFSLIRDENLRNVVNGIGTSFNALTNDQLNGLKQAADVLIHQDPCFQQFLHDVDGTSMPPDMACASAPATH